MFVSTLILQVLWIYLLTFLVAIIVSYFIISITDSSVKSMEILFVKKRKKLGKVIAVKKQDAESKINDHKSYCISNHELDVKQLVDRSNKVILNINSIALTKLKKYSDIEKQCYLDLEKLIHQIIEKLEK